MELHFSLKKAWTDLFSNRKYVLELLSLMALMSVLMLVAQFSSLKLLPILGYVIWLGYLLLMCNNIINGKEPVLADIFSNLKGRNIFAVPLKFMVLGLIYGMFLGILWIITFLIFNNFLSMSSNNALIFSILISIPLLFFISFLGVLLYSENLQIRDGFNLKKGWTSFKYAWKDYLATVGFGVVAYILCVLVMVPIIILFALFLGFLVKSGIQIPKTTISLCSNTLGIVLGNFIGFPLGYFYHHILAQAYKYSLTKMN